MSTPAHTKAILEKIEKLLTLAKESGLEEVAIEIEDLKLRVRRSPQVKMSSITAAPTQIDQQIPVTNSSSVASSASSESTSKHITIYSPMIGTFYQSSNPDSPPFVKVGDTIKPGQVICIVEAMKLFNEIEAEQSGTIVKVLAENATPVAYDQPLFLIDPS